jgi:hypothetical protein
MLYLVAQILRWKAVKNPRQPLNFIGGQYIETRREKAA